MHRPFLHAPAFVIASIFLCLGSVQAKDPSPTAQLEKQVGSDLLSAKPSALELALTRCIQQNRKESHLFAAAILQSGRADANAIAPYLVLASIQALGKDINEKELTGVIYQSVKATPDAVLPIVDASARAVSQKLVPVIVSAAIHGVPDPYKMVEAVRKSSEKARKQSQEQPKDFKGGDSFKSVRSFKDDFKGTEEPYTDSTQTLAEAIVTTAINASGVSDPSEILAAADQALGTSLVHLLGGPGTTSPIGNPGVSNYGNEPLPPVVSK